MDGDAIQENTDGDDIRVKMVAVTWLEFEVVKGVKWVVTYHSYHW